MELKNLDFDINEMQDSDLIDVTSIERESYDFPWNESIFRDCLLSGYKCFALKKQGIVIGYAILSIVIDEAHVLNICIGKKYQNLGFGDKLLDYLVGESQQAGVKKIFLEVRPSNKKAIALYRKKGFEQIAKRSSYYRHSNGREDAEVYALNMGKIGYIDIQY